MMVSKLYFFTSTQTFSLLVLILSPTKGKSHCMPVNVTHVLLFSKLDIMYGNEM